MQKALNDAVRAVGEAAEKARPHVEGVITDLKDTAIHVEEWTKNEKNFEAVKNGAQAAIQEVSNSLACDMHANVDVDCQLRKRESWTHRWSTHDVCSRSYYSSFHGRSRSAGLYSSRHCRQ